VHRVAQENVLQLSFGESPDPNAILRAREEYERHLRHYYAIPTFPGEQDLWKSIKEGTASLDLALRRLRDRITARDVPSANWTLLYEVGQAADRTAAGLTRAIRFNTAHAQDAALSVESLRRKQLFLALGLDGAAILLALAAGFLALRAMNSYESLLAARADEWEGFAGRVAHDVRGPLSALQIGVRLFEQTLSRRLDAAPIVARLHRSLQRAD